MCIPHFFSRKCRKNNSCNKIPYSGPPRRCFIHPSCPKNQCVRMARRFCHQPVHILRAVLPVRIHCSDYPAVPNLLLNIIQPCLNCRALSSILFMPQDNTLSAYLLKNSLVLFPAAVVHHNNQIFQIPICIYNFFQPLIRIQCRDNYYPFHTKSLLSCVIDTV